jgi:putative transposase
VPKALKRTQTITIREGRANVFVAVGHANSEVVGIHASRSANRFEALEPVRQGVHRCFGAIAPGVARGLKLRHDHGSNYMSGDFQDEADREKIGHVRDDRRHAQLR